MFPKAVHPMEPPSLADGLDRSPISSFILSPLSSLSIVNNNIFGHSFHVHDVQFKIIARSSGAVGEHESGWKDTVYVPLGETVTVIAKFDDFSDAVNPYMYHCHFSNHEDGGMMGQFLVK